MVSRGKLYFTVLAFVILMACIVGAFTPLFSTVATIVQADTLISRQCSVDQIYFGARYACFNRVSREFYTEYNLNKNLYGFQHTVVNMCPVVEGMLNNGASWQVISCVVAAIAFVLGIVCCVQESPAGVKWAAVGLTAFLIITTVLNWAMGATIYNRDICGGRGAAANTRMMMGPSIPLYISATGLSVINTIIAVIGL